mmetsp:Transcript_101547/g.206194  ORF Transcript_101547/g.206194 Transcript_101547/m.206194 type:complete len:579 (-) Transcript_101547:1071-2807(-)
MNSTAAVSGAAISTAIGTTCATTVASGAWGAVGRWAWGSSTATVGGACLLVPTISCGSALLIRPLHARRWRPAIAAGRCTSLLRLHRRWSLKLDLRSLVTCIDAPLTLPAVFLCELHKIFERRVLCLHNFKEGVLIAYGHRVFDVLLQIRKLLTIEILQVESLPEVLGVVKGKVLRAEAWAVGIAQILFEGMEQEMQFIPRAQQHPVLVGEARKERLTVAEIADVLHCGNLDVLCVDLHGLSGFLLLLTSLRLRLLCLLLRLLLLLGDQRLLLRGVLPLILLLAPFLECLLPLRPRLFEGVPWFDVLRTGCQLLLQDPILEELVACGLCLPDTGDGVEALLFRGHGEVCEARQQGFLSDIWLFQLPIPKLLLFIGELHRRLIRLLLHLLILRFLLLLLHDLVFLTLLFLPRSLLRLPCFLCLPLFLLQKPVALSFLRLLLLRNLRLRLFVRQDQGPNLVFVLLAWLPHHHCSCFLESLRAELQKSLLSFRGNEVRLKLRHDVVLSQGRGDGHEHIAHAHIVHHRDPELHAWLVVGAPSVLRLRLPEATLRSPLDDLPVAKLCVRWICLQKRVYPIEKA